jgi:SAM-dependent methyltransferase
MATEPRTQRDEVEVLRARLDALEREQVERSARAHQALAAAQDKSYWLDRWHVDLNALMRSRLARELRVAIRAAQAGLGAAGQRRALRARLIGTPAHGGAPSGGQFTRALSPDLLHAAPISDLLYERLSAEDLAAVDACLEPAERDLRDAADPAERKRVTLALAAHHRVEGALEHTGLSGEMPGPEVATMARGALAAGGSYYYADLVADALGATGFELERGQVGLDFGCSSGRIVRVLSAAHPELEWHGCDPNPGAVGWASAHLPGIRFEQSPEAPRLPYADETFDFVYAISIWSHFAEAAALDWLDEMRRVLRPRGRLLLTTHGEHSLAHTHRVGQRSPEQLGAIRQALGERGFWYTPEYEGIGDHGIANPDWGIAFLTAEWLLARATPRWRVALFHPGRVEANHDLYVLERR